MNFDDMSKEDLINYIKSLDEDKNGKYGLIWDREKIPEKIVVECNKYIPILKNNNEYDILKAKSNNTNLLIEGDNFHSLSVLNYTHNGLIDVIYIDPPYFAGIYEKSLDAIKNICNGTVILEHVTEVIIPQNFEILKQKKYGDKIVTFLRYNS